MSPAVRDPSSVAMRPLRRAQATVAAFATLRSVAQRCDDRRFLHPAKCWMDMLNGSINLPGRH
jgi:hypothetical protein